MVLRMRVRWEVAIGCLAMCSGMLAQEARGEWCVDTEERKIYFWPPEALTEHNEVSVPVLDCLIDVCGASWVTLDGFTFTGTRNSGNNMHRTGHHGTGAMYPDPAYTYCGEAVRLKQAEYCRIVNSRFAEVGGNAICVEGYNLKNVIQANEIGHIGHCGITVIGAKDRETEVRMANAVRAVLGFALVAAWAVVAPAEAALYTVNVDFGTVAYSGTAAAPDTGRVWNNVGLGATNHLVASDGTLTGVGITLQNNLQGPTTQAAPQLAPNLLSDYVHVLGTNKSTSVTLSGLTASKYDVYVIAQNAVYGTIKVDYTIGGETKKITNAGDVDRFIEGTRRRHRRGGRSEATGGLRGGPAPESEPVVIRFRGADRPGEYQAKLRIVTQAMNTGVLSCGKPQRDRDISRGQWGTLGRYRRAMHGSPTRDIYMSLLKCRVQQDRPQHGPRNAGFRHVFSCCET